MSRRFSRTERMALILASGGRCERCGTDLQHGWHADHIEPWALGGATVAENAQALCPSCNLKKGKQQMTAWEDLRSWQKRFVGKFRAATESTFLLVALPGGGKTIAALYAAKEWLGNAVGRKRHLVVVVPSKNLRRQWSEVAHKRFGLELQTKEFDGALKPNMDGIVVTYQSVAGYAPNFHQLCARNEVMVVFDEVHHVGESAAWGEGIEEAFGAASKRLAMSGTPWRSDGGRIPYLEKEVETGEYVYHERFDWPQALETKPPVVRLLAFTPYHGFAEYESDGEVFRLSSHDKLSDEDEARCLRGRLNEHRFVEDVLRDAHAKLMSLRVRKPDAGGIVVCIDINHARQVASWLQGVTGERPVIATSDDEVSPGEPVTAFEKSSDKWIVSVRQVSEGVDIPRLMVGVYLTNYTTELFFRQFVGRIARYEGTEHDREASVFLPHHARLNAYAEKILDLQAIAIKAREEREADRAEADGLRPESAYVYLGGSEAESAGLILPALIDAKTCGPAAAQKITTFASTYDIPETTAARILRDNGLLREQQQASMPHNEERLEERLEHMRTRQHARIGYLARLTGRDYNDLNAEANRHVGVASVKDATEDQLQRRGIYIERCIREAQDAA